MLSREQAHGTELFFGYCQHQQHEQLTEGLLTKTVAFYFSSEHKTGPTATSAMLGFVLGLLDHVLSMSTAFKVFLTSVGKMFVAELSAC
jgi:hypothetical protein